MKAFLRTRFIIFIAAVLLFIGAIVTANCANYFSGLKYSPAGDYVYDIPAGAETGRYDVDITGDHFYWPAGRGRWDTAVLKIRIESGPFSFFHEPSIEITANGARSRQYFERRASGIRYLNLSNLSGASIRAGDCIKLSGNDLSWKEGNAELYLFDNSGLDKSSVLIFAPHPDDAEIGAFGFYKNNAKTAHIVTVTLGDAGTNLFPGMDDARYSYALVARLRSIDSVTAPLIAGVDFDNCINLGYFDSELETMYTHKGQAIQSRYTKENMVNGGRRNAGGFHLKNNIPATWNNLVGDIAAIIKYTKPTLILTPHPLLEGHKDHIYTSVAVMEALKKTGYMPEQVMFYLVHDNRNPMYPYGEAGSELALPKNSDGRMYFQTLYSYQMDKKTGLEKLAALESMHDIRNKAIVPSDGILAKIKAAIPRPVKGLVFPAKRHEYNPIDMTRCNELFYVYNKAGLKNILIGESRANHF